jgi:hypothetical protein
VTQTHLGSLIEVCFNILIGFTINLGASFIIYPMFGATFTFGQNINIALVFTVIAVVRGFVIRRWFNAKLHRAALKIAHEREA